MELKKLDLDPKLLNDEDVIDYLKKIEDIMEFAKQTNHEALIAEINKDRGIILRKTHIRQLYFDLQKIRSGKIASASIQPDAAPTEQPTPTPEVSAPPKNDFYFEPILQQQPEPKPYAATGPSHSDSIPEPKYNNFADTNTTSPGGDFFGGPTNDQYKQTDQQGQQGPQQPGGPDNPNGQGPSQPGMGAPGSGPMDADVKRKSSAALADILIDTYCNGTGFAFQHFTIIKQSKMDKMQAAGEVDFTQLTKALFPEPRVLSRAQYVREYNEECREMSAVDEGLKAAVRDPLIDWLQEKDWGVTPGQQIVGIIAMDIIGRGQKAMGLMNAMNDNLQFWKEQTANPNPYQKSNHDDDTYTSHEQNGSTIHKQEVQNAVAFEIIPNGNHNSSDQHS